MENASKALIIAAAMIIAVMILMILLYLFNLSATVPAQYERTKQDEMILAFNAKFEKYDWQADRDNDGWINLTIPAGAPATATPEIATPSNSFSDVITVCNLASDINTKSGNDRVNSVTIDFEIDGTNYCVTPRPNASGEFANLKRNFVYVGKSSEIIDTTGEIETKNLFDILETKISGTDNTLSDVKYWQGHKLRYRYYFECELSYGIGDEDAGEIDRPENIGKVVGVRFQMIETENFDSLT